MLVINVIFTNLSVMSLIIISFSEEIVETKQLCENNKTTQTSNEEEKSYLEKKYGKEPKISKEEHDKIRWKWH